MPSLTKFLAMLAIAAAAVSAPRTASAAFDCSVFGSPRIAVTTAAQTTTSITPVNLTGGEVEIQVGGQRCVIVDFTAQVRAAHGTLRVRVTVDGSALIQPNVVDFYTSADRPDTRAATFVLRNVAEGTRVIGIQFQSVNGFAVSLSKTTTMVRYEQGG